MEPVKISVQNLSTVVSDADAEAYAGALGAQLTQDYNGSCWVSQGLSAPVESVTLIAKGVPVPPDTWHMEILDDSDQPGALGYHEEGVFDSKVDGREAAGERDIVSQHPRKASRRSSRGLRADAPTLPLMKVFAKTSQEDGASLSEDMSHEALEACVDPRPMKEPRTVTNTAKQQTVIVEVGDPVQECGYEVAGQTVADFALPAWFGYEQHANPTQMSFRSSVKEPFELAPGGYISVAPASEPENWSQIFGSAPADQAPARTVAFTSEEAADLLDFMGPAPFQYGPPTPEFEDALHKYEALRAKLQTAAA